MNIQNSPFDQAHDQLNSISAALAALHDEEKLRWTRFESAREQVVITQRQLSDAYMAHQDGCATDEALKAALRTTANAGLELTSSLVSLHEISAQCIAVYKQLEMTRSTYMLEFGNKALPCM